MMDGGSDGEAAAAASQGRLTQAMIINDLSRHSRLRIGALAPCA
jgi:hypothetical protein